MPRFFKKLLFGLSHRQLASLLICLFIFSYLIINGDSTENCFHLSRTNEVFCAPVHLLYLLILNMLKSILNMHKIDQNERYFHTIQGAFQN